MTRKAISVLIAAVVAFSLLPAASAFAAATGTAHLTAGGEVLPAPATPFGITVQAADRPVNYVEFFYPKDKAGISGNPVNPITPPDGWQGGYRVAGAINSIVFYGGQILPGGKTDFPFPGDVARPFDRDLTGTWRVKLSSNGGATLADASVTPRQSLNSTVRILDTETVSLVSPNGILDKTGTEHQPIQMQTTVKNYALSTVEVTPTLDASAGFFYTNDEKITTGAPQMVAAGGVGTFAHAVTLGSAKDNTGGATDKPTEFEADATAPGSNGFKSEVLEDFIVQVRPKISLPSTANVQPRTFPARDVVTQATTNMPLRKANTPGVNLTSGTMTFGNSSCALATPAAFANGHPAETTLGWTCSIEAFQGEESFDANVTLTGTDDNDAPFSATYTPMKDNRTPSSTLRFTLDSIIPIVNLDLQLPRDGDGNQQTALKKGDTVRISGTVEDGDANLDFVELRSNTGEPAVRVDVTEIPDLTFDGTRFVGDVKVPFEAPTGVVYAYGVATDPAGWTGEGLSLTHDLDNVLPLLNYAETKSTTDVEELVFEGEYKETLIKVGFAENNTALGGCDPSQWTVDGAQVVVAVLMPDGDGTSWVVCEKGQAAPNGSDDRILLLGVPIDRNATPSVTYTPGAGDRVADGAGNFALERVVDTVAGIAPPLPQLIEVYRNTGTIATGEECADKCETAYEDEDKYWTRFGGNDLLVHVERGAPGYTLQVLDALGTVIASKAVATSTPSIRVPIGTTDGDYARGLRFVNARGITSDEVLELNIALDTVLPQLASPVEVTEAGSKDQVKVPFSEKVVEGSEIASNWPLFDEFAPGRYYQYEADEVRADPKPPFSTEKGYRVLTANLERDGDTFAGAGYNLNPFVTNNVRYGDRAGNQLADVNEPAAKPAPSAAGILP